MVDRNLLSESQITRLKRPLYFGQYAYSVGFSPNALNWARFDELKEGLVTGLQKFDHNLNANHSTLDYHVFSSDVGALRWLVAHNAPYAFRHLRLVSEEGWHLPKARTKAKSKFYNLYGWRITLRDAAWPDDPRNREFLNGLSGDHKVIQVPVFYQNPKSFIYLAHKNDVLLFKMMAAEHILDIEDRSTL